MESSIVKRPLSQNWAKIIIPKKPQSTAGISLKDILTMPYPA